MFCHCNLGKVFSKFLVVVSCGVLLTYRHGVSMTSKYSCVSFTRGHVVHLTPLFGLSLMPWLAMLERLGP